MIRLWIGIMSLVAAVVCMAFPVHAADARFSWTPNTESDLAGYKIYCGTAPRSYQFVIDQGAGTVVADKVIGSVPNLTAGTTYYCAATAYDSDGFESDFSTEISLTAVDQVYPAAPGDLQVVILRRNPDGTADLLDADGNVVAAGVVLP